MENAGLASSVRVLGTIRRGVLEGLRVHDETWSFSSEFRYGGADIRRALIERRSGDFVTEALADWQPV